MLGVTLYQAGAIIRTQINEAVSKTFVSLRLWLYWNYFKRKYLHCLCIKTFIIIHASNVGLQCNLTSA